ncbi:lipopolysaccharide biosynthesis protein [Rufibacter quisquiliarum]|uniref:O-antigen/teichoic acid export membrane protein n=1 Tax=Rufibacter quisquiliarum TaxID=1549639 RepID=A0A839GKS5_9BACT|nr:polysaccharide biosynthesis C-terminal domain-containing protein [Rufibacter quisquiliarum]MBA9079452.1 O-antigen/teichoic acid export membrane protein [Rufibacter quisquiliarum]
MDVIRKQSYLNTLISTVGMVVGYLNTVLVLPHFLNDPDKVGLTRFLISVAPVFAQFAALGFTNTSARFFPYFRDRDKQHNGFLFLMLVIPLAGFVVVTALFLLLKPAVIDYFGKNSPLAVEYYYYIIPLSFFTLLFLLLDAYLRALYKSVVQTFLQDFLVRILTMVTAALYVLGWVDFQWFVILFIAANSSSALICIVYLLWLRQFFVRPGRNMFQIVPIKEVVQYGFYSFLGGISSTVITFTDSAMIMAMSPRGLADVAFYTTGYFITSAILVPYRSMNKVLTAQVADLFKLGDFPALGHLYKRMTRVNLVIGLLLFLGIWCNVDNIFSFMPPEYSAGRYVILFMGIARIFELGTGLNAMILITSHRYRYDLILNILMVALVITTNYLLIPPFGINGAAFASMLVFVAVNMLRVAFVAFFFKMQPFGWDSLALLAIAAVAFVASWLLPRLPHVLLDIAVRFALITGIYAGLVLMSKVSPEVNEGFRKTKKRFLS